MPIKTIGAVLLLCITVYLCVAFTWNEARRLRQLEGLLLLLRTVRGQISCFRTPVDRIYASFENEALERCGFLPALRQTGDFTQALEAVGPRLLMPEEEARLLSSFGLELGGTYRDEQVAACDYYISELENCFARRREERPRRLRLGRSLLLTGGLMLILVFI